MIRSAYATAPGGSSLTVTPGRRNFYAAGVMVQRQDFIPLSIAAAIAHERLFPGERRMEARMLEVIALALSGLITVHRLQSGEDRTLEIVSRAEMLEALPSLKLATVESGRLSLTRRQSPRQQ